MNSERALRFVERAWEEEALPALEEQIAIPAQSPAFDPDWESSGHLHRAVERAAAWCREHAGPGAAVEVLEPAGRTPLLLVEIPGTAPGTALLYGHLDKQPPATGWSKGLGPYTPVRRGDRLYGRGAVDDGYALFADLIAIRAAAEQGLALPRCLVLIETGEESLSVDLPYYLDRLADRLGSPDLVVCPDSGGGDYDRLWVTTSLRGSLIGTLTVSLLTEGIHSGQGSGLVASAFRVARRLLSRLEDEATGEILPADFQVEIPPERRREAEALAALLGDGVYRWLPLVEGVRSIAEDPVELLLNQSWRPALAVTGQSGLPPIDEGGNVLYPESALKISLRIPPGVDPGPAGRALQRLFENNPPYGARVRFELAAKSRGWSAPGAEPWLTKAVDAASRAFYSNPPVYLGLGGGITLMQLLAERFPKAQFLVTGAAGPSSNAHGPDEHLSITAAKKVTASIARVLAEIGEDLRG